MCRIAGIINPSKTVNELELHVKAMCNIMKHGGPDDEGIYTDGTAHLCLGNRRLSLVDLSKAGHQPMQDPSGRCHISFNGEIYNYRELKQELLRKGHSFRSQTDTEVILIAYLEWGTAAFERLSGMFAFALYDCKSGELFLVRDPAGIKPLYYQNKGGCLSFASEIKAFKESGDHYDINPDWRLMLLCFGHIPEPYSTLKSVLSLPKGHYMRFCIHSKHNTKIVAFNVNKELPVISDKKAAITAIQERLAESVEREMKCDAELGIMLSGGIDSSIIALLADKSKEQQTKTISLDFDDTGYSETVHQENIIAQLHPSHSSRTLSLTDMESNFDSIKTAYDQPSCDGINTWFISKFAHEQGLKAIVSGIGGDELFGGYPSFRRLGIISAIQKLPEKLLKVSSRLPFQQLGRLQWLRLANKSTGMFLALRGLFSPSQAGEILGISSKEVFDRIDALDLQPHMPATLPRNEMAGWLEFNLYMQNQLLKDSDYMSMKHAVELRVPFLGKDFLEAVSHIEPLLLFEHTGMPKQLLIDAFKDQLPRSIWDRPKMGFTLPLDSWLKQIPDLRAKLTEEKNGSALMHDFDTGKVHWSKVWAYYISLEFAA